MGRTIEERVRELEDRVEAQAASGASADGRLARLEDLAKIVGTFMRLFGRRISSGYGLGKSPIGTDPGARKDLAPIPSRPGSSGGADPGKE